MKTINKLFCMMAVGLAIVQFSGCGASEESIPGDKLHLEELAFSLRNHLEHGPITSVDTAVAKPDTVPTDPNKVVPLEDANAPKNRSDLESMRTVVKIFYGSKNAGITLPGFGTKLQKDESSLNVYYIETKVVIKDKDSLVYGIGYSVHYLFKKLQKGIDIKDFPNVAASAQLNSNKTQVSYTIQTYGIHGLILGKFFDPTGDSNFNVEGFGAMKSSIKGIHTTIMDETLSKLVKYTPTQIKFVRPYDLEQAK